MKTFVVTMNCFDLESINYPFTVRPFVWVGETPYIIALVCSCTCRYNYSSFISEEFLRKTATGKFVRMNRR